MHPAHVPHATGEDLGVAVVHHAGPRGTLDEAMRRLAVAAPGAAVVLVVTGPVTPDPGEGWPPGTRVARVENHSYSRAVDRGLAALGSRRYLALMNDDVLVTSRTFADLVGALEARPGAGAAGPLAFDAAGRLQAMGLPYRTVQHRALAAAARAGWTVRPPATGGRVEAAAPRDGVPPAVEAPWLAGFLVVLTRQAFLATGGYDEAFRFTNEDLDHGRRAARLGYANLLVATPVTHLGGTSTPSHPAFHVEGRRGGYLVTLRHLPPAARLPHRAFLLAEGVIGGLVARDARRRSAHRSVARMAWRGEWDASPFGATLDER